MKRLESIYFNGKLHPVQFKQTPNYSETNMRKIGMVWHVTTSNSYLGGLSWLTSKRSNASTLFIIGREIGQITQMGYVDQKLWHAGRISKPSERFTQIAKLNPAGDYLNPNFYLDGVEFVGGVDKNKDGKVHQNEIELTEWQYVCAEIISTWHAKVCDYELAPDNQIMHQDIAHYKPDLYQVIDELHYRLFTKSERNEYAIQCEYEKKVLEDRVTFLENLLHKFVSFYMALVKKYG